MGIPGAQKKADQVARRDPKRVPGSYLLTHEKNAVERILYLVLGEEAVATNVGSGTILVCENVNRASETRLTSSEVDQLDLFRGPQCPDFPDEL